MRQPPRHRVALRENALEQRPPGPSHVPTWEWNARHHARWHGLDNRLVPAQSVTTGSRGKRRRDQPLELHAGAQCLAPFAGGLVRPPQARQGATAPAYARQPEAPAPPRPRACVRRGRGGRERPAAQPAGREPERGREDARGEGGDSRCQGAALPRVRNPRERGRVRVLRRRLEEAGAWQGHTSRR